MKHCKGPLGFLIVLMVGLPLALAEPRQEDATRYYEDALSRFKRDDMAAAIVQLKNVLKLEPGMLAARVLLGKAYLRQGDPAAAEEAFTKALQLGVDRSEVVVPLAQALRDQGKYKDLLEKHSPERLPPAQKVDLLVLRGQAFRAVGDRHAAAAAFEEARRIDPKHVPALLAQADFLLLQGKRPEAAKLVDLALSVSPNDLTAWNFSARISQLSGDIATALSAYGKAISIEPHSLDARIGRATLLMDLKRDQEVSNDIEYLKRENPKDPRANYLRSVYLSRKGDNAGARAALQDIKQMLDPVPRQRLMQLAPGLVLIGALSHYGLGETKQAREYIRDYLKVDTDHPGARKLLGSILLAQGKAEEAINMLEVVRLRAPSDPQLLALLAAAYMERHKYGTATEYLERALQTSGDDPEIQATLGLSLLGGGRRDLALEHLRQALQDDPRQFRVGVALAVLYLREGLPKDAVQVAEAVVRGDPKNAAALNLLGVIKVAAGDRKEGRAAYLKAIESDRNFFPPQLNLAKLDGIEGNYSAARERLLAALKIRPKDTQAMYELGLVEQGMDNASEALRWLEKGHALNRRNTMVSSLLVQLYISQNRTEAALNAAQETESALPDDLSALASLGEAYVAVGNLDRARTIFDRMGVIAGFDVKGQYRVAVHQIHAKNPHGAERALERVLSVNPDFLPAVVLSAETDVRSGAMARAEERARMVVNKNPNKAVGYRLSGDIAMAKGNFPGAIKSYLTALSKEPNSEGAIRLYQAYMESGATAKASEHLEAWVRTNPMDIQGIHALAETRLRAGEWASARSGYERLLKLGEEKPAVYNNLANILARQNDPQALSYAQKASALAPNDPAVQDTLGWILVQQGQLDMGLRQLREARLRDPQSYEVRYHLAVALNRMGHADEAKTELEPAISGDAHFDGREEARSLWQQLSIKK